MTRVQKTLSCWQMQIIYGREDSRRMPEMSYVKPCQGGPDFELKPLKSLMPLGRTRKVPDSTFDDK